MHLDCMCVCVCVCVRCSDQPGYDSPTILYVSFLIVLCGRNALVHLALDCWLCMASTLAHPALMLALCVKYLLFVWLCFAVWYVPCVCKCMYNVVCVVCDALVHLMCVCVLCSCCACRVRFACADRGGGDHMTQQKHVWCRANSNGCVCFLHVAYALPTLFDCCMCMRCAKDAVAHLCVMIPLPGQCCGPTLFDLCYVCVIYPPMLSLPSGCAVL